MSLFENREVSSAVVIVANVYLCELFNCGLAQHTLVVPYFHLMSYSDALVAI